MLNTSEMPEIIRKYILYIRASQGKASKTADDYYRDLRLFFRFIKHRFGLATKTPIDEIDISDVDINLIKKITLLDAYEFFIYCKDVRDNNEKSRARRVSSIKQFFEYLSSESGQKQLTANPLSELTAPKLRKNLPKHLTLEESLALLNAIDGEYKERNYAIVVTFLNCGIRLAELCAININDLNFTEKRFKVRGKGGKERIIYMNDAVAQALEDYLKIRRAKVSKEKEALFLSRNDNRISDRMVKLMVENLLKKAGLAGLGYSVHKLRHTAATLMYQHGGVDIRTLQEILGHENLGTTQIYTHVSSEQVKQAVDSNPLAGIKK